MFLPMYYRTVYLSHAYLPRKQKLTQWQGEEVMDIWRCEFEKRESTKNVRKAFWAQVDRKSGCQNFAKVVINVGSSEDLAEAMRTMWYEKAETRARAKAKA